VRLQAFDYSQPGRYFLTVCTQNKEALFGEVIGHGVRLSAVGQIVDRCWLAIPAHFPQAEPITHVVMPDHLHAIIGLRHEGGKTVRASPEKQPRDFAVPVTGSIATIVGVFKAAVSRHMSEAGARRGGSGSIWQRGYYEHVIRNEQEFRNACEYIRMNPARHSFKQQS
jgi:REP element-mobilizing transposase RayT